MVTFFVVGANGICPLFVLDLIEKRYILAGQEIEIVIYPNGNWRFIGLTQSAHFLLQGRQKMCLLRKSYYSS
jgi:hypothetical protein